MYMLKRIYFQDGNVTQYTKETGLFSMLLVDFVYGIMLYDNHHEQRLIIIALAMMDYLFGLEHRVHICIQYIYSIYVYIQREMYYYYLQLFLVTHLDLNTNRFSILTQIFFLDVTYTSRQYLLSQQLTVAYNLNCFTTQNLII